MITRGGHDAYLIRLKVCNARPTGKMRRLCAPVKRRCHMESEFEVQGGRSFLSPSAGVEPYFQKMKQPVGRRLEMVASLIMQST